MTGEALDGQPEQAAEPILQRGDLVRISHYIPHMCTERPEQAWYLGLRSPALIDLEGRFQGYMMDFTFLGWENWVACAIQFDDGDYVVCARFEIDLVERWAGTNEIPKLPN